MGQLASAADANTHLDESKIRFISDADAAAEAQEAFDVIAARIGALWPDRITTWDFNPGAGEESTPQVVRQIASLLMASYRYAKRYSEEELSENDYAARLERRALSMLDALAKGEIILWDKDYGADSLAIGLERDDFWPNDTYTPEYVEYQKEIDQELQPSRAFSMDLDL